MIQCISPVDGRVYAEREALTLEAAKAYAEKNGIAYRVQEPKEMRRRQISYAENFRYDRKIPWTH